MKKLVAAFVGLNILDIGLTLVLVGGGHATELNPFVAKMLTLPLPTILAYKTLLPLVFGLSLVALDKSERLRRIACPKGVLIIVTIAMSFVCLFNLASIAYLQT